MQVVVYCKKCVDQFGDLQQYILQQTDRSHIKRNEETKRLELKDGESEETKQEYRRRKEVAKGQLEAAEVVLETYRKVRRDAMDSIRMDPRLYSPRARQMMPELALISKQLKARQFKTGIPCIPFFEEIIIPLVLLDVGVMPVLGEGVKERKGSALQDWMHIGLLIERSRAGERIQSPDPQDPKVEAYPRPSTRSAHSSSGLPPGRRPPKYKPYVEWGAWDEATMLPCLAKIGVEGWIGEVKEAEGWVEGVEGVE